MHAVELAMHRKNTVAFIDADPIDILLVRYEKVQTSSGGVKWTLSETQPNLQTFRLIPNSDATASSMTSDGVVAPIAYTLLGLWDADLRQWDRFFLNETEFELAGPLHPVHSVDSIYERKCAVVRRGRE